MFTPHPPRGSQLRAVTRQAATRLRRLAAALAAVTCTLLASAAVIPAASAAEQVKDPPTGASTPIPAPTAQAAAGGMAAWQIILIALGAPRAAPMGAVIGDRTLVPRRSASSTTA